MNPFSDDLDNSSGSSSPLSSALAIAFGSAPSPFEVNEPEAQPEEIGRYGIERLLGLGAYGIVYLGRDDRLNRAVAIKVPHRKFIDLQLDSYLQEARALAMLDHQNIVPIYDVGSSEDWPCYVVSKFVDGGSLSQRLRERDLTRTEAAKLASNVARALHHAHKRNLVHRDVKPGNLLLDQDGTVFVADFGIALNGIKPQGDSIHVGTPAYMSPEQARGEGHRVDGRSDIYSLGVVLYEMITGRRPFRAERKADLIQLVIDAEPKPPRQIDETIPLELERICLKAMSKRVRERYTTAHDMAEDLALFLADHDSSTVPKVRSIPASAKEASLPTPTPSVASPGVFSTGDQDVKVIPKGLRSFDGRDAEFFLNLLPGPRDRNGVPDSLRFWIARIEETNPAATFSVGLIYGPSGCGKSSFVKAGLIPQLSPDALPTFLEANADSTDSLLLAELKRSCSWLPSDVSLPEAIVRLRENDSPCRKVVIFIDQFEQWLHANSLGQKDDLAAALRQCDGANVQCILMVRDDFWMAVTRFLRDLEVPMMEGHNTAAVDLFSIKHAQRVLGHFGRAFGALPDNPVELTGVQKEFIRLAVSTLAEQDKVVCVRLAMFAQMIKDQSWSVRTLEEVGGTAVVGVAFLEQTFGPTAAPRRRYHEKGARLVLEALLPNVGVDIKGRKISRHELLQASGYEKRVNDFSDLLKLLDRELRLITPLDAAGRETGSEASNGASVGGFYHLTHDFLVPSLREWLTRKQRETRRGRAELLLTERSSTWNESPSKRHLPSLLEYLSIVLFTGHQSWTKPQRKLMDNANAYFGFRTVVACLIVAAFAFSGVAIRNRLEHQREEARTQNRIENAKTRVGSLLAAPPDAIPYAIANIEPIREHAVPELAQRVEDLSLPIEQRFVAACGLAHFGDVRCEIFVDAMKDVSDSQSLNIGRAMGQAKERAVTALQKEFDAQADDVEYRARLAVMLLNFGQVEAARSMLHFVAPDPTERVTFIATFPAWCSNLQPLSESLELEDSVFRSGLCNALAEVPLNEISDEIRSVLRPILLELASNDPCPGVHSSAGLVLRRWGIPLPPTKNANEQRARRMAELNKRVLSLSEVIVETRRAAAIGSRQAPAGPITVDNTLHSLFEQYTHAQTELVELENSWYVNSLGMTMITFNPPQASDHKFAICDRQVTVGQFQEFVADTGYEWRYFVEYSPTNDHPVEAVSWIDATHFCNWLSEREGLQPCYVGEQLVASANGYRLPSYNDEVLVYRRALSTTMFFCGPDSRHLPLYAVYNTDLAEPCALKLPNRWGVFDVVGNVLEWAQDRNGPGGRTYHSGSFVMGANGLRSHETDGRPQAQRRRTHGFRIARSSSSPPAFDLDAFLSNATSNQLTFLEDYSNAVVMGDVLLATVREAMEPNLPSYASIDAKLDRPLIVDGKAKQSSGESQTKLQPFLDFAADIDDADTRRRIQYANARLQQLNGNFQQALLTYESLSEVDLHRPEPLTRLIECLYSMDKTSAATKLMEGIRCFPEHRRLWDLWMCISVSLLNKQPQELIAQLEEMPSDVRNLPHVQDTRFILERLQAGSAVAINCGAEEDSMIDGQLWSHDRFFHGGQTGRLPTSVAGTGEAEVGRNVRSFDHSTGGHYRIPLPKGTYQVSLYFAEGWFRTLGLRRQDVVLEGNAVLEDYDSMEPGFAKTDRKQFEVDVVDGLLDIEFLPKADMPIINGIRVESIR